jgi:hypothetical protein
MTLPFDQAEAVRGLGESNWLDPAVDIINDGRTETVRSDPTSGSAHPLQPPRSNPPGMTSAGSYGFLVST